MSAVTMTQEKFRELTQAYALALTKLGTVAHYVGFEPDADLETIRAQVIAAMAKSGGLNE